MGLPLTQSPCSVRSVTNTSSPHPLLHPFSVVAKPEAQFINVVKAEGTTLYDDAGNSYLDGMASLWYCQVGHGRTEIIDAIAEQLHRTGSYSIFDPFTSEVARTAATMIVERSPHPDGRVMLGCSGSEAVDSALKFARLIQQRRNQPDKQIIVRRTGAYHGTTIGATTAQGLAPNREGWGDLVPHFIEVPASDSEALATVFAEHGPNIAAVISEPVQGAGGVWPPVEGYHETSRRLCDLHDALLIFDEVICGFARTGSWFGAQTYGVTPDLMVFAKGATSGYQPLSGVIMSRAVAAELEEDDSFLLRHGYTYSGHAGSCAAAIANINIIEREELVNRASHVGEQISTGLAALQGDGLIKSYRGVGAMWAADLGRPSQEASGQLLAKGLVSRGFGDALILCPPLIITDDEIAQFIEAIAELEAPPS